jgi:hypothetical protein
MIGSITVSCVGACGIVARGVGCWGASGVVGGMVAPGHELRQRSAMLLGPGITGRGASVEQVLGFCSVPCAITRWRFCDSVAGVSLMWFPP